MTKKKVDEMFGKIRCRRCGIYAVENSKCTHCGAIHERNIEFHTNYKITSNKTGYNSLENGQTLCIDCYNLKKNYSQTEVGKKYFMKIYKQAIEFNDTKMINFCKDIIETFEKHKIDNVNILQ